MRLSRTVRAPVPLPRGANLAVAGLRNLVTHEVYRFAAAQLQPVLTIGRADTCDIVLTDCQISAVHCRIECLDDGTYLLRDHGSTNGTHVLVAGVPERIAVILLAVGTRILLGEVTLAAVDAAGYTLLHGMDEGEFRRAAYRVYGSTLVAGRAIGKSSESVRRALRKAQGKRARNRPMIE